MKILSVFIAVLILGMGFDLCRDAGLPDGKAKTELSKENGKKETSETGCSAFCHCVRCSFSLLPEDFNKYSSLSPSGIQFFTFSNSAPSGISCAVWQPPKTA